jgi:cytochrome c-type biogenesis protein CcmH
MVFILIASAMLCIAAACVVVPLWRGRTTGDTPYEMAYRTEHADQLDELARDLADGRLAAEDHDAARRDLDHELEASLRHAGTGSSTKVKAHRILAVATGALLLIGMGVGYWQLGNWRIAVEGVPAATTHEMDMMVAHLSRRLHTRDQNDLQGWVMLGNAYVLMDRYKDAVEALGRARKLSGDSDPGLLASYAEALTLAEPDQFMQKAAPLFEKVLQNDPTNIRALWYGGLAALNRGDKTLAVQRWRKIYQRNIRQW